ncbi:MAG TPA: alpha/beta hydrolase [Ktedonobacteraceae bacterium]|jgi:pimeloyl-ACP methyl ester carboxylesterase|nr:alpha/beta hydrolase [Ktedonobacteraceae bacterium]
MPAQPVDGFVTANGLQIHYRRWSAAQVNENLPPILLLHGLASSVHIWNFVAPLLAEHGYVVTALDQRGHGESEKPTSGYDFATIVADDGAAVQALGIAHPVVVGHSWGASVALEYAATYPDDVTSVVLVDGGVGQLSARSEWTREKAIETLAPPRFAGTPREAFLSYARRGPLNEVWSPELEDSLLHIVQLREDDTVAPRLDYENHLQIIGAMWDQPTFDLYKQVRCPIKIIVAERQPTNETEQQFALYRQQGLARIQEMRPDVQIVRMANTVHDIPFQRPRELAQEILSYAPPQA